MVLGAGRDVQSHLSIIVQVVKHLPSTAPSGWVEMSQSLRLQPFPHRNRTWATAKPHEVSVLVTGFTCLYSEDQQLTELGFHNSHGRWWPCDMMQTHHGVSVLLSSLTVCSVVSLSYKLFTKAWLLSPTCLISCLKAISTECRLLMGNSKSKDTFTWWASEDLATSLVPETLWRRTLLLLSIWGTWYTLNSGGGSTSWRIQGHWEPCNPILCSWYPSRT